ncbi:hypothetical protein SKAU_G00202630 [Synaphobranchus kaupii]|uniref:Reverse transcriptase domain-containing protein n=1 Tax=Synaphobranchus kaupii TaxID=118154 RepID=A0A9Q1FFT1_SYNKA|nr:hypothetical protein SKAU_G00202630 [Synaphobranchus kaupii]
MQITDEILQSAVTEHFAWCGLRSITDYKGRKSSDAQPAASLPHELNTFYARFEASNTIPIVRLAEDQDDCTLSLSTADGCILSPLLYALFTHDFVATHSSNAILKFADDTTILGLISNNDETAYREEVSVLATWCQDNNLSLNICKT